MSVVTGTNTVNISINQQGGIGLASSTGNLPAAVISLRSLFPTTGTGAGQLSLVHAKTYTFVAATPQTLDLHALLDVAGNAISFSAVRFLMYRIQSANAAFVITAGAAGANEWNGRLSSGATEIWFPSAAGVDGFAVIQAPSATGIPVAGGSRLLKLDPGANAVGAVDIIIAGS